MALDSIVVMAIAFSIAIIMSEIADRLKISRVVAQIIAGIILGIPIIKMTIGGGVGVISLLGNIGVVFLLFLTGLEVDFRRMRKTSKDASIISVLSAITPVILGYLGLKILLHYSNLVSFVGGMALAVTAQGIMLTVLSESGKLNTKVGITMLEAGMLDDIFEFSFITIILFLAHKGTGESLAQLPYKIIFFTGVIYALFKLIVPWMRKHFIDKERGAESFSIVLGIGIVVAAISTLLDFGPIIGAFIAGTIINITRKGEKSENLIINELKIVTLGFVIPFFFINIGMGFDFTSMQLSPAVFIIITLAAIIGKVFGSLLSGFFTKFSVSQLILIGWGMNTRGTIELVIAGLAKEAGLIPVEVYSAIVGMTLITTLIFPFVLRFYLKKYPKIMN